MTGLTEPASWPNQSSYSDNGGACVETAVLPARRIALRHSKQPDGAVLLYTRPSGAPSSKA